MSTLTDEQLATLTPEEREAIQESEYSEAELAAMSKIAGESDGPDDDDDEGDDEGDDDAADASAAAPVEGKAAPVETSVEPVAEPPKAPEPSGDFTPQYDAKLPQDFDAQVKALADQQAELKRRFQEGELDFEAYEVARDELVGQREALTVARAKAETFTELNAQTQAQRWQNAVMSFAARTAAEGAVDYRKDEAKARDLDVFVRTLAADPANADKAHDWFLTEAHKRVLALHDIRPQAKAPEPAKGKPPSRTPPVAAVAPSLANVPGGDGPGDVGSEFADIDALDGTDLEAAIARMTPAQRERYAMAR